MIVLLIRILIAVAVAGCSTSEPSPRTVVFVCEHGSAKSVVAAALFNNLAATRNLPYRAVARGLDPDPVLAPGVVRGLAGDGMVPPAPVPIVLTNGDRHTALRVVFLGDGTCDVGSRCEIWSEIPSVSRDYAAARDVMRTEVERLVARLPR